MAENYQNSGMSEEAIVEALQKINTKIEPLDARLEQVGLDVNGVSEEVYPFDQQGLLDTQLQNMQVAGIPDNIYSNKTPNWHLYRKPPPGQASMFGPAADFNNPSNWESQDNYNQRQEDIQRGQVAMDAIYDKYEVPIDIAGFLMPWGFGKKVTVPAKYGPRLLKWLSKLGKNSKKGDKVKDATNASLKSSDQVLNKSDEILKTASNTFNKPGTGFSPSYLYKNPVIQKTESMLRYPFTKNNRPGLLGYGGEGYMRSPLGRGKDYLKRAGQYYLGGEGLNLGIDQISGKLGANEGEGYKVPFGLYHNFDEWWPTSQFQPDMATLARSLTSDDENIEFQKKKSGKRLEMDFSGNKSKVDNTFVKKDRIQEVFGVDLGIVNTDINDKKRTIEAPINLGVTRTDIDQRNLDQKFIQDSLRGVRQLQIKNRIDSLRNR